VKRFGLDSFLFEMSKLYEIIIFTASQKLYASRIIDMIDPKNRVSHRLYREHCRTVNKTYFLKDVRTLGRNPKDIIIVDDNNIAGLLQPENFYKIDPFEGSEKDRQLCRLSAFLKHLHEKQSFTSVRQEFRDF
jgi:Dullard-like phosphatase family protein